MLSICPYQEINGQKDILKEHCINKGEIMNEMKTMDYQRFNDYRTKLSKPIDLGFFDKLLIAEEIAINSLSKKPRSIGLLNLVR